MKRFLVALSFLILFFVNFIHAQPSYIKTFGDPKDKPLIFLHGGPGSNAGSFEITTAEQISAMGYFVVVYDRRGEGRSVDYNAKYTFRQTFKDLNAIYRRYSIKKATLIGYSFGGVLGTLYAEKYSEKVSSLVLLSSLLSLQDTYATIIAKSDSIFKAKNDTSALRDIAITKKMDSSSIEFRLSCFAFATQTVFLKHRIQMNCLSH
ncbi:alpha/beta fold hydrolase [Chitinophaga pinensis]|uniref:Proline iminopeptidase n=1 Tax=Chitinophaga pinensis TaxID=79329 RepID=A0A5C6LPU5_9BACT|nr:alpha/beta fold hydrolase [Chitinophaga pinensis]TWV94011.1 alpha/beta hydrolase [Chitinophaga pinensis]